MELNKFLSLEERYTEIFFWNEELAQICRQLVKTYPSIRATLYFGKEKIDGKHLVFSNVIGHEVKPSLISLLFSLNQDYGFVVNLPSGSTFALVQSFFESNGWRLSGDETTKMGINFLEKIEI